MHDAGRRRRANDAVNPFATTVPAHGSADATSLRAAFTRGWRVPPAGVVVGLADLSDWHPWHEQADALLSDAERQRVARKRMPADREQLALTYALHRLFLGAVLDLPPADVPLGRDHEGRPRLGIDGARTSLSHASGVAAFAFCATGVVGVDVEPRGRATVMAEIETRVAHPEEQARLPPTVARADALLALWVRKEAFLKAVGTGLSWEMQRFVADDGAVLDTAIVQSPDTDCAGTDALRVQGLALHDAFVLAVAAPPATGLQARRLLPG